MKRKSYKWLRESLPFSVRSYIDRKKIIKKFHQQISEAKQENPDSIEEINFFYSEELQTIEDERSAFYTQKLIRKATKFRVPIPAYDCKFNEEGEFWEISSRTGDRFLTLKGINMLREEIRKEERWKRESRSHWLTIITTVSGLVGILTGLIAVIKK